MEKVQVIIFRKTERGIEFLLLRKKGEKVFWQGVTGGVESYDKSIRDAAFREVNEELQIDTSINELMGPVYDFTFATQRKGHEGQKVREFCFSLEIASKSSIQLSEEHDIYRWLSYEKALQLIAHDDPKKVVRIIYSKLV